MIEKLKAIFKYVLLPLTLLGAGIFYLFQRINSLTSALAQAQAEKKLAKTLTEIEDAKNEADQKEIDYRAVVDEFRKQRDGGGAGDGNNSG